MQEGQGGAKYLQMGSENSWIADESVQKSTDSSTGEWAQQPKKGKGESWPEVETI